MSARHEHMSNLQTRMVCWLRRWYSRPSAFKGSPVTKTKKRWIQNVTESTHKEYKIICQQTRPHQPSEQGATYLSSYRHCIWP